MPEGRPRRGGRGEAGPRGLRASGRAWRGLLLAALAGLAGWAALPAQAAPAPAAQTAQQEAPAASRPAARPALREVRAVSLPGERVGIELRFSAPPGEPRSFATERPPRIALDFPGARSALPRKSVRVDKGPVRSVTAVEAGGRTRVVISLLHPAAYQLRREDGRVILVLEGGPARAAAPAPAARPGPAAGPAQAAPQAQAAGPRIEKVDFRRGPDGEGRVLVSLSDPAVPVDVDRRGDLVVVSFPGTRLPVALERRLDVTDFATPVLTVDAYGEDGSSRLEIRAKPPFESLAYQTDGRFVVEIKPKRAAQAKGPAKRRYKGRKLSLNFQDIDVRAALQVIADFTGLNMVVSDSVKGHLSLRLKDVPWDQALDIILRTKGLGMRRMGNVILVAPNEELAAREKQELEARKQIAQLEPLRSEVLQINYAKAADLAALIRSKDNSLLSERGTVSVDERTNTLLVRDTAASIEAVRKLVARLDRPVRQVLIESRIVIANDDFSRELGMRFGATAARKNGNDGLVSFSGSAEGNDALVNKALTNIGSTGQPLPVGVPALGDRLSVSLPVQNPAGRFALAILGKDYLVDLELSALQAEGRGEIISSPRVITANQKAALIEQGVEIPYQQATSSGATSVEFKKAVLSLEVTPQITPDDRIIMDLKVSKDSVGEIFQGVPSINTREVNTQVLVDNGETVVLGGIYEQTRNHQASKVPVLGDLPVVGALFRSTLRENKKAELLIFVTPKILKEGLQAR
ncbi:MAG: type IV pilus secretin PilQ [Gammaproteobacteria bacterium]|nr:MAG: type IV pilus secretin PilQ [Gammaproteobacteria bacterium]